jgi:hypothetical protein
MPINRLPSKQEKLERMFEFTNDLVDILGNIEAGKCDTIDFYCRAFEFMWGAKLSTNQVERKSPWNWDLENLKTVWAAKNLTPPTHG